MINHDELNAAVQRAYAIGENVILTVHGIGFVAHKQTDRVIVSQMGGGSNHFILNAESFETHGLGQATVASMSEQFFQKEEHAGL